MFLIEKRPLSRSLCGRIYIAMTVASSPGWTADRHCESGLVSEITAPCFSFLFCTAVKAQIPVAVGSPQGPPFCSQLFRVIQRGMPKAENLVPRAVTCPLPAELGFRGFPQPDTHLGPHGKLVAVLPCLPTQSTGTLVGCGFSPIFPPYPWPHTEVSDLLEIDMHAAVKARSE